MCDPVPNPPAILSCGYCGLCEACVQISRDSLAKQIPADEEPVRVFVDPATVLPPTGAVPSNPAVDPGLQSDRWSLHQQQFGGPHAGKLKKIGQPLDPKDLTIEVAHNNRHQVLVKLSHKPTGLSVEESGRSDHKEIIHSRLYWELKGKVEKHYEGAAAAIDKAVRASPPDFPPGRTAIVHPTADEALVMEAFDFGQFSKDMIGTNAVGRGLPGRGLAEPVRVALCNVLDQMHNRLYGKGMAIAAEVPPQTFIDTSGHTSLSPEMLAKGHRIIPSDEGARTVPEPQPAVWLDKDGFAYGRVSDEQIEVVLEQALANVRKRSGLGKPDGPEPLKSGEKVA